jgi:hypothetical protein
MLVVTDTVLLWEDRLEWFLWSSAPPPALKSSISCRRKLSWPSMSAADTLRLLFSLDTDPPPKLLYILISVTN